jgi:hypothetical protein
MTTTTTTKEKKKKKTTTTTVVVRWGEDDSHVATVERDVQGGCMHLDRPAHDASVCGWYSLVTRQLKGTTKETTQNDNSRSHDQPR